MARRAVRRIPALGVVVVLAVGGSVLPTGVAVAAKAGKCGKAPFTGTISRTDDGTQPAAEVSGGDIESATVFDFGNRKNYTIYLAEHDFDVSTLGETIEAPPGEVLVTIALDAKDGKNLKPGQELRPGRDRSVVLIDAGGGAKAVTTDPGGSVTIQRLSKKLVCFAIDYHDRYQRIDGTVRARIP